MKSIRQTLLVSLLACLLVSFIVATAVAYINMKQELRELFSDNMKRIASTIEVQAFPHALTQDNHASILDDEQDETYTIQLWDKNSQLLSSTQSDAAIPLQGKEGLSSFNSQEHKWDVYEHRVDGKGFVQIIQPREMVDAVISETVSFALIPFGALFVILGMSIWFIVGRSLLPLTHLSKIITRREVEQRDRFSIEKIPKEIQPLVNALNLMLEKLETAMDKQRRFTADAAHELRTPLTALSLQMDVLKRTKSEVEQAEAVSRLSSGIERSIHLINQLLHAARSSEIKVSSDFQFIDLKEVTRSCLATFVPFVLTKNIEMTFQAIDSCFIKGDEQGLCSLINNLIDNAIHYTPHGGAIGVKLIKTHKNVSLIVTDTGVGIPKSRREKVFERFYRMSNTQSVGSGLGLSIVKNVADAHGAKINILDGANNKGCHIEVVFTIQENIEY